MAIDFLNAAAQKKAGLGILSSTDFIHPQEDDRVYSVEDTVTLAQLNTGKTIITAVGGRTIEVVGILLVFTGAFTTATDIRISDTSSGPVDVVTVAIAGATNGARINDTSTTNVTFGAGYMTPLTADYGLQVRKTGSSAAGGTSILVRVFYKLS
jgi:hypothetical protein